jgi:TolB-like protein/tetratricopeptide (TPR) repeat protein
MPDELGQPPTIPDFELVRRIGRGSYGEVWLARGVTGLWRAVKIVRRAHFADAAPFEREFRGLREFAALAVGESGQLALLHVGRDDSAGFFYSVMELADDAAGSAPLDPARYMPLTLAELHRRRGRLPADEAIRLGTDLARALAALHARGLVHRDIKPSNIVLVGGRPKLADIGLVAPSASAPTFVGTEGYVPPEGPGSPAADVFALGKVLYELASGLDRHAYPKLPDAFARLPDRRALLALNRIILRACESHPARRYRDGAALLAPLARLAAGRPGPRLPLRRLGALAAAALAVAAVVVWRAPRPAPSAASAPPSAPTAAASPPPSPPAAPAATPAEFAPQSVAVLPFANVGGDRARDFLADGISEEILNALAREPGLRVAASTSSFSFKGRAVPVAEIARQLGVAQLVEGSVQFSADRARVHVRLTRTADGVTANLGTFEGPTTDLFALEDEIARAVVTRLTQRVLPRAVPALTAHPAAYEAYLHGRALQSRSAVGAGQAVAHYRQAVALDPAFAAAWARLASALFRPFPSQNDWSPALAAEVRDALARALALQPDLPEALVARASWHRHVTGDLVAARLDLARAAATHPPTAQHRMVEAVLAADAADWPAALRLAREALLLDPLNGDTANAVALIFFQPRGDFAEADRLFARAVAIQGPGAYVPFANRVFLREAWRGHAAALRLIERAPPDQRGRHSLRLRQLAALGRTAEAAALVDTAFRDTAADSPTAAASAEIRENLGADVLLALGRGELLRARSEKSRAEARRQLDRGNPAPNVYQRLASAELALGDRRAALVQLEAWRRAMADRPGAFARLGVFHRKAAPYYAELGLADEAVALLRETHAHGYVGLGILPRDEFSFAPVRTDPRIAEFFARLDAHAAAQPDPADDPAPLPAPAAPPSPAAVLAADARSHSAGPSTRAGLDLALELGRRATDLDPRLARAWSARAAAHALYVFRRFVVHADAQRHARDAESFAQRALALDPADPDALAALGLLAATQGAPAQAEARYRAALAVAPGHLVASRSLAQLLRTTGRSDAAVALLREIADRHPGDALALHLLGNIYAFRWDYARAWTEFENAQLLRPYAAAQASLARLALNWKGDVPLMRRLLDQVEPAARTDDDYLMLDLMCSLLERRPDRLREAAGRTADDFVWPWQQPKAGFLALAYTFEGKPHLALREWREAERVLREKLRTAPDTPLWRLRLALTLAYQDRLDEARAEYAAAEAAWGENLDASRAGSLAGFHAACGDAPRAVALLRRAVHHGNGIAPHTVFDLQLQPWYDRIRASPEFQALLAAPPPRPAPVE